MNWGLDVAWWICRSCVKDVILSIQSILLYVDPKKYSFFSHLERERGHKSKLFRIVLSIFLYFLSVNFDSFQMLPFLLFCQINKKEYCTIWVADVCIFIDSFYDILHWSSRQSHWYQNETVKWRGQNPNYWSFSHLSLRRLSRTVSGRGHPDTDFYSDSFSVVYRPL